jgi:hypothetical protein
LTSPARFYANPTSSERIKRCASRQKRLFCFLGSSQVHFPLLQFRSRFPREGDISPD